MVTNNKKIIIKKPLVLLAGFFIFFVLFFLLNLSHYSAEAAFTPQINYQGKLSNSAGNPLEGDYNLRFRICEDTLCTTPYWTEVRTSTNKVTITGGLFSVMLGSVEPFPEGFNFNRPLYFEVAIGGTGVPAWSVLLPQRLIGAVPNAFNSEKIDGLSTSSLVVLNRANIFNQDNLFVATTTFTGNVLIGTTTPNDYNLTVAGDSYFIGNVNVVGTTTSSHLIVGDKDFYIEIKKEPYGDGEVTMISSKVYDEYEAEYSNAPTFAKGGLTIYNDKPTQDLFKIDGLNFLTAEGENNYLSLLYLLNNRLNMYTEGLDIKSNVPAYEVRVHDVYFGIIEERPVTGTGLNWTNPEKSFDGDLLTYSNTNLAVNTTTSYLILEHTSSTLTDSVTAWISSNGDNYVDKIGVDVFYGGVWNNIYLEEIDENNSFFKFNEYVEYPVGSTEDISAVRFVFYSSYTGIRESLAISNASGLFKYSEQGDKTSIFFRDKIRIGTVALILPETKEINLGAVSGKINNNSSTTWQGGLSFDVFNYQNPNLPLTAIEINGNGNVGIGTATPAEKLVVDGRIQMSDWTVGGDTAVYKNASGTFGLQVSDQRLKKNIENITGALDIVKSIRGVKFNFNDQADATKKTLGVIAQELLPVIPEAVYSVINANNEEYYGVHYEKIGAILIEAIKEQQQQIDLLSSGLNLKVTNSDFEDIASLPVTEFNPQFNTLRVTSTSNFYSTITVFGEAEFRSKVTFKEDLEIEGKFYVSTEQAGTVKIPAGETLVEVKFAGEYKFIPKIVANLVGDDETTFVNWKVIKKSVNGFTIITQQAVNEVLTFDWIALVVKEHGVSETIKSSNNGEVGTETQVKE